MCSKKTSKVEESNKKRLESLNERLNEFQLKKKLVRLSLHDLDSGKKPTKIIFDDDDGGGEVNGNGISGDETSVPPKKPRMTENVDNGVKKMKLIDSESDPEDDSNELTVKMFESKANMDQKKANKLIYLKTKFSNDDKRFKIDERFIEDDDDESAAKKESDEEAGAQEPDDHDDDQESRPKKSNKKQLKKEKLSALKILEQITAKPILKPVDEDLDDKQKKDLDRKSMKAKPIVRYDPTKDDHRRFELNGDKKETSEESSSEEEGAKMEASKEVKEKKPLEDKTKYVKIEPNLKDLFSTNDVFKFQFTNDDEENQDDDHISDDSDRDDRSRNLKLSIMSMKKSKYSSSSEAESESDDDSKYEKAESIPAAAKRPIKPNEVKSFLPDFDNDKEIQDAIEYFGNRDSEDLKAFREQWSANREKLVQECKKKSKRMQRIKKNQENHNLLPWRTSNKTILNKKRWKK